MRALIFAGFTYFAIVFAVAFALGVLRVTVVAPRLGDLAAVALEVPVLLALSWGVAGWIGRRWPRPMPWRLMMGLLAFAMLMVAEVALSTRVFGQSLAQFLDEIATAPGGLGLAGQIGFALIPALRLQTSG